MRLGLLNRLRHMDAAEVRFRAVTAVRAGVDRARSAIVRPVWRRDALRLSADPSLADARKALSAQDWLAAHRLIAGHFANRPAAFPLDPKRLQNLAERIHLRFPDAAEAPRATRVLKGRYDLLGYRDISASSPPDWHTDPVHSRTAPLAFWDSVPYLDPDCGDHKITWELNRHQHFLSLGRAYALTGDQRFYREFVTQITDWIRMNPPLTGTNWASMLEIAFRSLSWIWALHFFAGAAGEADTEPWTVDLLMALDRQLAHVEQNLSRYFSPNTHLTGEALALYVAGRSLPELASSRAWQQTGRGVLLAEASRQIRDDGMHAELSAHYHRYSTDFYLLALHVARITTDDQEPSFRAAAQRQAGVLRALADDHGRLPLLGDDDGGQLFPICGRVPADCSDTLATAAILLGEVSLALGAPPEETYWQCGSTTDVEAFGTGTTLRGAAVARSTALPASGYYISRNDLGDHLIFDCGPHGFMNGGHAHSDALAVVLTIRGRPFLVDAGTATYTMDPEMRDRFRSTAMHNTVVIDDRPQSESSGPFHWRTRADARCTAWQTSPHRDYVSGRHDAYAPIVHTREVMSLHGTGWIIVDHITGGGQVSAAAMWHIHPDWVLERLDGNVAALRHQDGLKITFTTSAPLHSVTADGLDQYAPEYGRIERSLCLQTTMRAEAPFSLAAFIVASSMHPLP
jgi:uncharacterized heparinase superfamily protein